MSIATSDPSVDHPGGRGPADGSPGHSRASGLVLTITGVIGLIAAVVLLVEKMALLADPDYVPTCSINPVLSCGSVMVTPQAAAFGIPNPILGIAGFAAVTTIGVGLLAGARFAAWFRAATVLGVTFGIVFVHWLIYQSLYVIGALCPYCMVVWAVMIPLFVHVTLSALTERSGGAPSRPVQLASDYQIVVVTVWYLAIFVLIAHRFWSYWTTLG
ncbi:vitamin K epoxide reductase family protein [Agilicoccus flavus]|uniref:vitamin K epoxide reductase family protein n=1 Tax=Agilicoccus flavus TaxID=2775968 RepID=UPI001CF6589C|nr:vitamin K epoxide reductase family protein [Agilicoccus flavus]